MTNESNGSLWSPVSVAQRMCRRARVLQGNPRTIVTGSFPGVNVPQDPQLSFPSNLVLVKEPSTLHRSNQWNGRPKHLLSSVTDVIGGKSPIPGINVRMLSTAVP